MKNFAKFSFVFLILFNKLFGAEFSEFKPLNGWVEHELKGRVKSVELNQIWHDNKNKNEKTITFFNEQGYVTKEIVKIDNKKEKSVEYTLNAQNFPLSAKTNDDTQIKFSYAILSDDTLLQSADEFKDGKKLAQAQTIVKKFRKDGKILTEQIKQDKHIIAEFHTIYDEKGNKIKEQDGSGIVIFDITYIFNEQGKLKQKSLLSPIESKVQYILYENDHVTLIQNTEMQKPDGSEPALLDSWRYENTTDKQGNLTNVKIYDDTKRLVREDIYKYEYYK